MNNLLVVITRDVYKNAVKAADDILNWAVKTYPLLKAKGFPKILGTYAFASAVFRESGYTWYETSGEDAFVLTTTIRERYPMISLIRSQYVVRESRGVLTYYAVNERFIEYIGNATYYLPTVDEVERIFNSIGRIPTLSPLLLLPSKDQLIRKILEVHLHGRSPYKDGQAP